MAMLDLAQVLTFGQVCERLGTREHIIEHAVRSGKLKPCGRVGILRVFSPEAVDEFGKLLAERGKHDRDSSALLVEGEG
ncbi:MAG: hypothetical protein AMXMBFR7_26760 [Planctomycetota bacterium]